jgi:micrococcal nuclease
MLAAVLVVGMAVACDGSAVDEGTGTGQTAPSTGQSPTGASPTSTALPPGLTPAKVTRVVDGDTIEVEVDGEVYKVRYIGIDTPESVDPRRAVECFGKEAAERNRELVEGRDVGLEKDVSETDAFGRLLRYVWLDGRLVNARLVTEGYALAATYPPDVRYSELFADLQSEARSTGLGLWGAACAGDATPGAETPTEPQPGGATCEFSNSADPVIKGNISFGTVEKIYHVPGGEFYDDTKIATQDGERWFCAEADAVAAGWRRSMR